ncbi:type II secretion system F family protein [Halobacillus seohaensis]|uniref:Type II secretion system F family protein n=1 Tax=Halobacillus seohaensis TaxID=447421 RepID=A0ABW2ENT0_9BACI
MYLLILLSFMLVTFVLVTQAVLQVAFRRSLKVNQRVKVFMDMNGIETVTKKEKQVKQTPRRVTRVTNKAKNLIENRLTKETESELDRKLKGAGLAYRWTAVDFRLIQVLVTLLLFSFSMVLVLLGDGSFVTMVVFSGALGALGFYYPSFYLSVKKRKRVEDVQRKLADFFDMVNLSIEAGMGLDAALMKACRHIKGPLSEEFKKALDEMRLGKSRREAFKNLRERVPAEEFQSIMTSIIQADQLGIGMTTALRTLTERIRDHQRQLAREKAMKAPVKMLFPMVFFIFPSLFIVLLGPIVVHLVVNGLG